MAIHRTKEQKMTAQLRREQLYSLPDITEMKTEKLQKKSDASGSTTLLSYPQKMIIHDLLRTFFSLAVILGILVVVWWYLQ